MTDLETAIMIKNMARETVRQMSAKNGRYGAAVEYIKNGEFMNRRFNSVEEAEKWAKSQGWKKGNPWDTKRADEYRIVEL